MARGERTRTHLQAMLAVPVIVAQDPHTRTAEGLSWLGACPSRVLDALELGH